VKVSSYWAVNRTAIFSLSTEQKEKEATRNMAVMSLSAAIGSAVSGLGIAYIGFSFTLSILVFASAIVGVPAALLWKTRKRKPRPRIQKAIASIDPRDRGRPFWFISFTLLFQRLAEYSLLAFLLPVFMAQQLGYDYITIGISFMLYKLISSCVTLGTIKMRLSGKRVVIQSLISLFATFLLTNSNSYFLVLFWAIALAQGLGVGFYESIVAKATKSRPTVSVDIGLLHIPMRLAEFTSVLCAGFAIQYFGYMPVFAASGIFFTIFSVLSFSALRT